MKRKRKETRRVSEDVLAVAHERDVVQKGCEEKGEVSNLLKVSRSENTTARHVPDAHKT